MKGVGCRELTETAVKVENKWQVISEIENYETA